MSPVDVDTHIAAPDAFERMTLELRNDGVARQRYAIDYPAEGVDDEAYCFVGWDGVVCVLDEELDGTGDLAFVSRKIGPVDGDLSWFGHCLTR